MEQTEEVKWLAVMARSLAFLCLKNSEFVGKPMLERARFLEALGVPFEECAAIIGSTPASMKKLAQVARRKRDK